MEMSRAWFGEVKKEEAPEEEKNKVPQPNREEHDAKVQKIQDEIDKLTKKQKERFSAQCHGFLTDFFFFGLCVCRQIDTCHRSKMYRYVRASNIYVYNT